MTDATGRYSIIIAMMSGDWRQQPHDGVAIS